MRPPGDREGDRRHLARRLTAAGLPPDVRVVVHENRRVLVHVRGDRVRVHRAFAHAPDGTLRALVTFARDPRRAARAAARRELASFRVYDYVPALPPRTPTVRPRPGDLAIVQRLQARHADFNAGHFAGALTLPRFRISHRMRRRLGEVVVPPDGGCTVVISRRHVDLDGWDEVERTLLHEMVHQWQVENGLRLDHGAGFRRKALEIGVEPSAHRVIPPATRQGHTRRMHVV